MSTLFYLLHSSEKIITARLYINVSTPNYYAKDAQSFKDLEHEAEEVTEREFTDATALNRLRHFLRMCDILRMEAKARISISIRHSDEESEKNYRRLLDRIDTFMYFIKDQLDCRMTVIKKYMEGNYLY